MKEVVDSDNRVSMDVVDNEWVEPQGVHKILQVVLGYLVIPSSLTYHSDPLTYESSYYHSLYHLNSFYDFSLLTLNALE